MGIRQWFGIGGSSDGTTDGTWSLWKVVSGVGFVHAVLDAADPVIVAMGTALQKIATEVGVGDGLRVKQETANKLNCTEASAADIKSAVQIIDDPVATQDDAAAKFEVIGGALTDPLSLGADGVAGKVRRFLTDSKAILLTRAMLAVIGSTTPTPQVGTSGNLTLDVTYEIRAGKTVKFHPLQSGVSVSVVTAAGEAVLATGKAVVFTDLNTDASTVTTMRATLAASNAAGLVRIDLGTAVGGDTWNHLLTLADTPLWAAGTVTAGAIMGQRVDDGTIVPLPLCVQDYPAQDAGLPMSLTAYASPATLPAGVSADADSVRATGSPKGETYSYLSRLGYAEDSARGVERVERQGTETGRSAVSAIVVAAGTSGRIYGWALEGGAGGTTFNIRKDAVVGGAIITQIVLAANAYDMRCVPDWPYGNGLYCEIVAGGNGAFNFVVRNS